MSGPDDDEMIIESKYAYRRAAQLSRETGMTMDEVVEDALRQYVLPAGKQDGEGAAS